MSHHLHEDHPLFHKSLQSFLLNQPLLDLVGISGCNSLERRKNSNVLSYVARARTLGVKRRTVSILWF